MSDDVERLQAAARQLIAAGRAFLDIVEDVVEDPERVTGAATTAVKVVKGAVNGLGTIDLDDPWVGAARSDDTGRDDAVDPDAAAPAGAAGRSDESTEPDDADDAGNAVAGDDADLIQQWSSERSAPSRVRRVSLD